MSNYLILAGSGTLLLEASGSLLLQDQTVKEPLVILHSSESLKPPKIHEETTFLFEATLIDEDDAQVALSEIDSLVLLVQEPAGGTRLRLEECLNQNDVTVTEGANSTTLQWLGQVQDTRLVDRTNTVEQRRATFEYNHHSDSDGSAADILSTTTGSSSVSVTITGHGLTVGSTGHHVFLNAADAIGGLTIRGGYRITSVDDADTVTIDAHCAATSTVSSDGGTCEWWLNGKVNKAVFRFAVHRDEPCVPSS